MQRRKQRLDQALVDGAWVESRTRAQAAILAGRVRVNGQPMTKPGETIPLDARIEILAGEKYVSRGGHKLEHALHAFGLEVSGQRALDLGSSTGGFTDCLLQAGAREVHAVDVGHGQLDWKLRQDPRVTVRERTNARFLQPTDFPEPFVPFEMVVIDCSFISLRLLLPVLPALLADGAPVVALVKPQFEAGKAEVDRGQGVIRDPLIHQQVLAGLKDFVERGVPTLKWAGQTESPLLGPAGNREFLVLLKHLPTS